MGGQGSLRSGDGGPGIPGALGFVGATSQWVGQQQGERWSPKVYVYMYINCRYKQGEHCEQGVTPGGKSYIDRHGSILT